VLKIQPEGSQLAAMDSGAQIVTSQMAGSIVVMRTPEPFDGKRTIIFFTFVNNGQFPVNVGPENITSTQVAVVSYDQLIAEQKRSEGVDKFIAALGAVGKTLSATDAGNQSTVTSYSGYANCGIGCGGTYSGSAVSRTYSPYAAQQAQAQAAAENAAAASEMHSGHASERNAIARNLQTTTVNPGNYITGMLTFEVPTAVRRSKKAVPISLAIRMGSDVHMLKGYAGPLGVTPPAISSIASSQITQPLANSIVPQNSSSSNVYEGGAEAQYTLGVSYAIGRGVAQDYATAVGYFRKAADKGYAQAQNYLGTMYENGRGVAQDESIAADWYRRAADQGFAYAQNNLGEMYAIGKGVAQNESAAVNLFHKAAAQGVVLAQYNLGVMYSNGRGVTQDEATAADWYRKAADKGYVQAQSNLDFMNAKAQRQTKPNPALSAALAVIESPATGNAFEDGYTYGYRLWEAKLYREAQSTLSETLAKFPNHKRASYARTLLGRAWLDDKKPATAVRVFYDNYKADPRGARAPDSLFFLGSALTDLGKATEACEAFSELTKSYPDEATGRLADRLKSGKIRAKCK
jgi:TPR repeat protein